MRLYNRTLIVDLAVFIHHRACKLVVWQPFNSLLFWIILRLRSLRASLSLAFFILFLPNSFAFLRSLRLVRSEILWVLNLLSLALKPFCDLARLPRTVRSGRSIQRDVRHLNIVMLPSHLLFFRIIFVIIIIFPFIIHLFSFLRLILLRFFAWIWLNMRNSIVLQNVCLNLSLVSFSVNLNYAVHQYCYE